MQQESIPVGCILPALVVAGGWSGPRGVPVKEEKSDIKKKIHFRSVWMGCYIKTIDILFEKKK